MFNLYDDIPDNYNMQKMIYDDNKTVQDLINHIKITENQKNNAKPYDYNPNPNPNPNSNPNPNPNSNSNHNTPLAALVCDEQIGGNQKSGVAPEPSETKQGGSMGFKIQTKNSLKKTGKCTSLPPA